MLTLDDFPNLEQYVFKSSPESCSGNSYTTDITDLHSSDEDFLQQLSSDLDIPLLLNPGEDELNLLNSFFDKSPEEILSEIAVPPDFTKSESSSSSQSNSPPPDVKIEPFVYPPTTQIVPDTTKTTLVLKDEVKIEPKSPKPGGRIVPQSQRMPVKRSIHPKSTLYQHKNNVVLIRSANPVSPQPPAAKVVVLENIVPSSPIPMTTINVNSITTSPVPSVVVNGNNMLTFNNIDPKILKKQQRKIKNRESACLSRKKKKDYLTSLENQVKELGNENQKLKMQNLQLKEKLSKYEKLITFNPNSKNMKGSLVLCIFLLCLGVNIDYFKGPFSNRPVQKLSDNLPQIHGHGRNLLWSDVIDNNNTDSFQFLTMCPAAVNQTESARLVSELERWIGKPKKADEILNVTKVATKQQSRKRKLYRKKIVTPLPISSSLTTLDQRGGSNNELKLFSAWDSTYRDFFEAINRQDDTFYVVSLSDHNMLLPALYHNKTRRPKMSLIMPSVLPTINGNSSNLTFVPLMQIDCEVLDTRLIKVQYGIIPQHLRSFDANKTQTDNEDVEKNVGPERKESNQTNQKPYKPYFVNTESGFYNIP